MVRQHAWKTNFKSKARRIEYYKRNQCIALGVPYDLDLEWIFERITKGCQLTGLPFKIDSDKVCSESPSIDRINPADGYIKTNCRMILNGLNCLKGSGTEDKMYEIAIALSKTRSPISKAVAMPLGKPVSTPKLPEPLFFTDAELLYHLCLHFTDRQAEIILKRKNGELLTKTEKEYYSRVMKKRLTILKDIDAPWIPFII